MFLTCHNSTALTYNVYVSCMHISTDIYTVVSSVLFVIHLERFVSWFERVDEFNSHMIFIPKLKNMKKKMNKKNILWFKYWHLALILVMMPWMFFVINSLVEIYAVFGFKKRWKTASTSAILSSTNFGVRYQNSRNWSFWTFYDISRSIYCVGAASRYSFSEHSVYIRWRFSFWGFCKFYFIIYFQKASRCNFFGREIFWMYWIN